MNRIKVKLFGLKFLSLKTILSQVDFKTKNIIQNKIVKIFKVSIFPFFLPENIQQILFVA